MADILAPAGGMEQIYAAVRCGADAVYLGTQGFNARRNAANFDSVTLPAAVSYCHARNVKVYVTVNTVVLDSELEKLEEEADLIAFSGADAVIIQDMAVLKLFVNRYPSIRRFASTQTAVHDLNGALFLKDAGFDSVVLARELTLQEMERIIKGADLKTEAFVHGAHCMSVSGACYLSSMIGGRSGNRGLCAQPCRLDWNNGKNPYALSLKDMSLIDHIREMADIGIDTFKIEGRMKRPEYVAASVTACRKALAGEPYDLDSLRAVFSRSGFTDGYLTGRRDASMFGYRTKEDVTGAADAMGTLANLYKGVAPLVPVSAVFCMDGNSSSLTVSDGMNTASSEGPAPQKAINRPTDPAYAYSSLSKTGGTPFRLEKLECEISPGLMLPASAMNAMRRDALDSLLKAREKTVPHERKDWSFEKPLGYSSSSREPELWARFRCADSVTRPDVFSKLILPCSAITEKEIKAYGSRLMGELPAVLFPQDEDAFQKKLAELKSLGLEEVWADNIYGIELAKKLGLRFTGGSCLNITNTEALTFYEGHSPEALTVSFELAMDRIKELGGSVRRGMIAYGRLPLMRWRNCPVKAGIGCAACGGNGTLTDRKGITFPVECSQKKYSTLLNSVPLHIADRDLSGLDYAVLWFTDEDASLREQVVQDYLHKRRSSLPRTGGLYYRELL